MKIKIKKCHLCEKKFRKTNPKKRYCSYTCRSKAKTYRYGLKELFKLKKEDQVAYHAFRKKEGLN